MGTVAKTQNPINWHDLCKDCYVPSTIRRMTMEHYQEELLDRQEFDFDDEGDDAYEL